MIAGAIAVRRETFDIYISRLAARPSVLADMNSGQGRGVSESHYDIRVGVKCIRRE